MMQFPREMTAVSGKKIYAVDNVPAFWVGQFSGYEYSLKDNNKQLASLDMLDLSNRHEGQRRGN